MRQASIGFLVRFWLAPDGENQVWTGELRHVTTGHSVQFRGLDQLFTILQRVLHVAAEAACLDATEEEILETAKREA